MVHERLSLSIRTGEAIPTGEPGNPTTIAFVGPTGVGKTTTIAKLAAHFVLREKKPVGLVTLDTYRIAAVEQLRTYARIIDVPLEVALSPADLPAAVKRLSGASVILVDTAGRSQRDLMKMNDLKGFFGKKRPDQVHLVVSATAERTAIAEIIDKFGMYRPERILVTKVDELPGHGKLLDIATLSPHPVSYLTTGQDVPDDIETARPERLAALIAGEVSLDG
jgi:flagellar biosynthesis protein FlhF